MKALDTQHITKGQTNFGAWVLLYCLGFCYSICLESLQIHFWRPSLNEQAGVHVFFYFQHDFSDPQLVKTRVQNIFYFSLVRFSNGLIVLPDALIQFLRSYYVLLCVSSIFSLAW